MDRPMDLPYFSGETLDDIMRWVFEQILLRGQDIHPTKGTAKELSGVLLELTNPLARISRTETRGKPFSCLGELLWYLAQTDDLSLISYYIPKYRASAEGRRVFGGYGPRLFNWDGLNQFANVAQILKERPDSRRAIIQLFDAQDVAEARKDVPCTCTMQFMVRHQQLHMLVYMRSNDAFLGMPHDIFCFTILQEIMARTLSLELGQYKHMVGSLHLYNRDFGNAQHFLGEGWQSTTSLMPPMPAGDPCSAIKRVLLAEHAIRTEPEIDARPLLEGLDPYWADLVRLLLVFRAWKAGENHEIRAIRDEMSSPIFNSFISGRIKGVR